MRFGSLRLFVFAVLLVGACGAPDQPVTNGLSDAAAPPQDAASGECRDGESRACGCGAQAGSQACYMGTWSACYCAPVPREVSTAGDCLPGTYTGNFSGLAGTPIPFVPVTGLALDGQPPLVLELTSSAAVELSLVGSGTLAGSANGLFDFEASITGRLNCSTKKFTGKLEGSAEDVFGVFIHQVFVGNMTADYDAKLHEFVNGKWDLKSRDVNAVDGGTSLAPSDVTGNGDWNGKMGAVANAGGRP